MSRGIVTDKMISEIRGGITMSSAWPKGWLDKSLNNTLCNAIEDARDAVAVRDAVIREYADRCDRCFEYGNNRGGKIIKSQCELCIRALALLGEQATNQGEE